MNRPCIAITMGDPAGVGPEVCLRALNDPNVLRVCTPVVVGNSDVLGTIARRIGVPFAADKAHPDDVGEGFNPAGPTVVDMHVTALDHITPGRVSPTCGHAAYGYITFVVDCMMAGYFDAMTTAPICKEALHQAGIDFPGHTEILERLTRPSIDRTRSHPAVMMLYSPWVAVSLVTTHTALKNVPGALSRERIVHVIKLTYQAMKRLRGRAPRVAVLGLNCHAGEGGAFGDEEQRIIAPAIAEARSEGFQVDGPLPPDTAFTKRTLETFDAHVCMYHDQGLIPFKTLSFREGVNITLGIPIVRTSVDHGTAFDIAWQGKADHTSLVSAVVLASKLATKK